MKRDFLLLTLISFRSALLLSLIGSAALRAQPAMPDSLLRSATSLQFSAAGRTTLPATQKLFLAATAGTASYEAKIGYLSTATGWISVTPATGTTPSDLSVSVDPANLAPGMYMGYVEIASEPGKSTFTTVTLTVGDSQGSELPPAAVGQRAIPESTIGDDLSAFPPALSFQYLIGTAVPQYKPLFATRRGRSVKGTFETSDPWITLRPIGAIHSLAGIGIDPGGLDPGIYLGRVTLTTEAGTVASVPVRLDVCSQSCLTAQPSTVVFQASPGESAPTPQTIQIGSLGPGLSYTASVDSGSWLAIGPERGSTTGSNTLSVAVNPSDLPPGIHTGSILVTTPDATTSLSIPVVMDTRPAATGGLSVSPTSTCNGTTCVNLQASLGGVSKTLSLSVTTSAQMFNAHIYSLDGQSTQWLTISPSSGPPGTVTLTANPSTLTIASTYLAMLVFTDTNGGEVDVEVIFTVSSSQAPTLTPSPLSLSFSGTVGLPAPNSQPLHIGTSINGAAFQVSPSANWIIVDQTAAFAPADLTVSVSPLSLGTGTNNGTITITGGRTPVTVAVTFTISPNTTTLTPNPTALTFTTASAQQLSVTGAPTGTAYTASSSVSWLTVTPQNGQMPASLTVTPNASGLTAGPHTATLTVTAAGTSVSIQVTFTVSGGAAPTLTPTPTSLTFSQKLGGIAAPGQLLYVNSSLTGTSFTASANNASWLTVSPQSGVLPATLTVTPNAAGLPAGSNQVQITIVAGGTTLSVPVTFTVSSAGTTLTVAPTSLTFSQMYLGAAPSVQTLQVVGATAGTAFTASTNASWLVFSANGTTPANFSVGVNATGLPPSVYQSTINITAGTFVVPVPVTLNLTANTISTAPQSLSFSQVIGGATPAAQNITVSTIVPGATFTATVAAGSGWLSVTPSGGTTPGMIGVAVNTSGLTAGTYSSSLTINGAGMTATVPVTLTLSSSTAVLTPTPSSLTFAQTLGGATAAAQNVLIQAPTSGAFTASSNQNWLIVSPTSGAVPVNLSVSINPAGLAAGTSSGAVTVTTANGSISIPVTLNVSNGGSTGAPIVQPSTLTFTASGSAAPQPQVVSVTSPGANFTFAVAVTGGTNWLNATPSTATTPASLTVSVNPAALSTGQYTGTITLTPSDPSVPAQVIGVTLSVTSGTGSTSTPVVRSIMNAATMQPAPIAPGEVIVVQGTGLGPAVGSGPVTLPSGGIGSSVAGTQVFFDGIPSPLLFVRADQINAIVPYGVYGRFGTTLQIQTGGGLSAPLILQVAAAAPGVFTINASGTGQGAIVNYDGTSNTPASPAPRGSIVSIYATGEGQTRPAGQDGRIIMTDLRTPIAPVSVSIGGVPATVLYAGSAPTFVSGVLQINVLVPSDAIVSGQAPLTVTIAGIVSPLGVSMAVK